MLAQTLRRLGLQLPKYQPVQARRFAGDYAKPKVDTSLDHVFGDNSNKLSYNFEPLPMGSLFVRSVVMVGVFFFPVWIFLNDDYQYHNFQEQIAVAKAKQAA